MKMNIPYILRVDWLACLATMLLLVNGCAFRPSLVESTDGVLPGTQLLKMDKLGNYYEIAKQNTLKKFDPEGRFQYEYRHVSNPVITDIDVSDPYKILVFYRDPQRLIVLDNTLNYLTELDLTLLDNRYIGLVSRSEDGNYWMYDLNSQLLLMADEELEVIRESFPFYQEGIRQFSAQVMGAGVRGVLLADPVQGILEFDHLANYRRRWPEKDVADVWFFQNGEIGYLIRTGIYSIDPGIGERRKLLTFEDVLPNFMVLDLGKRRLVKLKKNNDRDFEIDQVIPIK